MNLLVNESVEHNKFGKGIIIREENYRVDIIFNNNSVKKSFLFPDAFEKFLKLENEDLQKECLELAVRKREQLEKEAEEMRLEQERIENEYIEEERKRKLELTKKKRSTAKKLA